MFNLSLQMDHINSWVLRLAHFSVHMMPLLNPLSWPFGSDEAICMY